MTIARRARVAPRAGRRKYRRTFDTLEPRELLAGDLGGALTHGLATPTTIEAHVRPFAPAPRTHLASTALVSRAQLPSAEQVVTQDVTPHKIETTSTNHTGPYGQEVWNQRWFMDADRVAYELQIFTGSATGPRVVFGQERMAGTEYVVEMWNPQGQRTSTSVYKSPVYDTRGLGQNLITQTTFLGNGQGQVDGKWDKGKWVETTTGSQAFKEQTAVFDKPGGTLLTRVTTANDGSKIDGKQNQNGQWVETTTGSKDFKTQTEVFDKPGGTLLSLTKILNDGTTVTGSLINGVWSETNQGPTDANSTAQLGANGTVTVTATDGSSTKVYQKVANGWQLISWNHYGLAGLFQAAPVWVEESWAPGGDLVENTWKQKQHGALGSTDQLSQLIVQKDKMTLTVYHAKGYPIYYGAQAADSADARVTLTYSRAQDGGNGQLLEYHVAENNSSWAADWKNPKAGLDLSGYYGTGWLEYYPWYWDLNPPFLGSPSVAAGTLRLVQHMNQVGVEERRGNAPVAVPAGVTATTAPANGNWTETVWNQARTQSLTFVYANKEQKDLIQQTYGRSEGGKWVATTDHSKAFITQTATYDKLGGNLLSSVTVRKAPDGQDVTFNGTWTSGTAVANATGTETASNYLGFSSVTVQYQNGKPVQRSGVLESYLGGLYATDTFNGSGTAVDKREISKTKGGPVVETWTGSNTEMTISRVNPEPNISQDSFHFRWDAPHTGKYWELFSYDATFVKPVDLLFEDGEITGSTQYHWRQFYSSSNDDWNYREKGSKGREYNATLSPNPQVGAFTEAKPYDYWNKV